MLLCAAPVFSLAILPIKPIKLKCLLQPMAPPSSICCTGNAALKRVHANSSLVFSCQNTSMQPNLFIQQAPTCASPFSYVGSRSNFKLYDQL